MLPRKAIAVDSDLARRASRTGFFPSKRNLVEWLLNQPVLNWKMVSKCGSSPKKFKSQNVPNETSRFPVGPQTIFFPLRGVVVQHGVPSIAQKKGITGLAV